jgi:hypothetical protein
MTSTPHVHWPLLVAAQGQKWLVCSALLATGSHDFDKLQLSHALWHAAAHGQLQLAEKLLSRGAWLTSWGGPVGEHEHRSNEGDDSETESNDNSDSSYDGGSDSGFDSDSDSGSDEDEGEDVEVQEAQMGQHEEVAGEGGNQGGHQQPGEQELPPQQQLLHHHHHNQILQQQHQQLLHHPQGSPSAAMGQVNADMLLHLAPPPNMPVGAAHPPALPNNGSHEQATDEAAFDSSDDEYEPDAGLDEELVLPGHPLIAAATNGHADMCSLLLKQGYSLGAGAEALVLAAKAGYLAVLHVLYQEAPGNLLLEGTAMYVAAQWGHVKVVQLFLDQGVCPYDASGNPDKQDVCCAVGCGRRRQHSGAEAAVEAWHGIAPKVGPQLVGSTAGSSSWRPSRNCGPAASSCTFQGQHTPGEKARVQVDRHL